jgi:hypothetical protein
MSSEPERGARRMVDGRLRVYYDGYWIKAYEVPADTLIAKKALIEALTRRLFNHVEHGINVPGNRLAEARSAFENETEADRRRVKGAMLAGALFNRATDIFTRLVDIQSLGVEIRADNALMRECGQCLQEALTLGKLVLHRSGEEGIDELWGEPFKAFAYPIEDFYTSRYVKIAMAMSAIDRIAAGLVHALTGAAAFDQLGPLVQTFCEAAKAKTETLRTDPDIFEIWTSFAVAGERLAAYPAEVAAGSNERERDWVQAGRTLLRDSRDVVFHITRARVPMPKTTQELLDRCGALRAVCPESQLAQRHVA